MKSYRKIKMTDSNGNIVTSKTIVTSPNGDVAIPKRLSNNMTSVSLKGFTVQEVTAIARNQQPKDWNLKFSWSQTKLTHVVDPDGYIEMYWSETFQKFVTIPE